MAHVGILSHSKLSMSIHSSHYSTELIRKSGKFSINLIDESFLAAADYTGGVSAAKKDKSDVFKYHLGEDGTPIIDISPLTMECEIFDTYEADGFINFFCTIKNTYIEEKLLDDKERIDYNRLKPVLFEMPTHKYLATGRILGDNVKMGKAYQSQMEK